MNKLNFIFAVCMLTFICPLAVSADIPMMLNYQGYVEDSGGTPIEGTVYLKFAIVNQTGDTSYWSNDGTSVGGDEPDNAVGLIASNGIFSLKLGNQDLTYMTALPTTPFDNQNIYIRVWFSEDNITFEQLTPDTQIASTGFAYMAQSVVNGITTETDPTITEVSIKDGVDWSELTGIPSGFLDGVDDIGSGSESDPVFLASAAAGITGTNITNWNTAYGWGNHASQGYITSETGDITAVNSGEGTKGGGTTGSPTIEFDCSEVAGSGISCSGENIEVYSLTGYNGGTANAIFAANNGYIGIGETSPLEKLHVDGAARFDLGGGSMTLSTPGGWPGVITYSPNGNRRDIQFYDLGIAITISNTSSAPTGARGIWINQSNGYVGMGDTAPAYRLEVNGDVNTINGGYRDSGSCVAGTCGSDKRLKKNILPLQNAMQVIDNLEPVTYEFIDEKFGSGTQYGLLAQDVEEIFPEWVVEDQEGIKKIRYGLQFQMFLIQAVKEQQVVIEELRQQINVLERNELTEMESLKDKIAALQAMVETFIAQQSKSKDSKSLLTLSKATRKLTPEEYLKN